MTAAIKAGTFSLKSTISKEKVSSSESILFPILKKRTLTAVRTKAMEEILMVKMAKTITRITLMEKIIQTKTQMRTLMRTLMRIRMRIPTRTQMKIQTRTPTMDLKTVEIILTQMALIILLMVMVQMETLMALMAITLITLITQQTTLMARLMKTLTTRIQLVETILLITLPMEQIRLMTKAQIPTIEDFRRLMKSLLIALQT